MWILPLGGGRDRDTCLCNEVLALPSSWEHAHRPLHTGFKIFCLLDEGSPKQSVFSCVLQHLYLT